MKNLTIEKSKLIETTKEKVWAVLLNDQFTKLWYAEFFEGAHALTDWKTGSKAIFSDLNGEGLIGKVVTNQPFEALSVEYTGVLTGGKEDYDSVLAKQVKGGSENYFLSEQNGKTQLEIKADMGEEHLDFMSEAWDRALEKIRELSMSQN